MLRHLIWVCAVCLWPTKKDARLIRVKAHADISSKVRDQNFGLSLTDLGKQNFLRKIVNICLR